MMRALLLGVIGLFVAAATFSAPRAAQAPDRVDELHKRIESLERMVVSNPLQPRATVVARLTEVERTLDDTDRLRERIVRAPAGADGSLVTQLEKIRQSQDELDRRLKAIEPRFGAVQPDESVDKLRRSQEELDRRIKAIETATNRQPPAAEAAVDQLRRTVGDFDRRLKSLEASQPRNPAAGGDVAALQREITALERQLAGLDGRVRNLERAK